MPSSHWPTAYVSIEANDPELFDQLSKRFPDMDISKSRNLLGIGETISIILAGVSALVAVLQYASDKKASVRDVKIQQSGSSKIVIIQVLGRNIDEVTNEITELCAGDEKTP